jgi:hypothetical protein
MVTAARWHTCARRRNRWLPRGRLSWMQSSRTACCHLISMPATIHENAEDQRSPSQCALLTNEFSNENNCALLANEFSNENNRFIESAPEKFCLVRPRKTRNRLSQPNKFGRLGNLSLFGFNSRQFPFSKGIAERWSAPNNAPGRGSSRPDALAPVPCRTDRSLQLSPSTDDWNGFPRRERRRGPSAPSTTAHLLQLLKGASARCCR